MKDNVQEEYILIWESPKIQKPEFRLYYDDQGYIICYTCEKLEGKYIIIDQQTYAEARPDLRIIDGKLSKVNPAMIVSKLVPDDDEGVKCAYEDMSIILTTKQKIKNKRWKLHTYELQ